MIDLDPTLHHRLAAVDHPAPGRTRLRRIGVGLVLLGAAGAGSPIAIVLTESLAAR